MTMIASPALAADSGPDSTARILGALVEANAGILGAVVGSPDGRAHAHAARAGHVFDAARVSAMASSLLALSASFSKEVLGKRLHYSSISTDGGTVVFVRTGTAEGARVLSLWADRSTNLGLVLRAALDAASRLTSGAGAPAESSL